MKPYYQHGGITIYHGDCRKVMPTIPSGSIDAIWTDPPYGNGNHQGDFNSRLNKHRNRKDVPIANDTPELMRDVVDAMFIEAVRVLKKDCCCCCCCGGGGPEPTFAWIANRMDSKGLKFFHSVIWDKRNPGIGWRYRRQHEMVMIAHRAGGKLRWANDNLAVPNVIPIFPDRERQHPNEKPIALVTKFLSWHCCESDIVLDPFMGSGTTLVAAKQLTLRATGIEIEEKYCEISARRLEMGKTAMKHADSGFKPLFKLE
jgi:site-specific DNA-methyltransferase (adenine-specific)